MIYKKFYIFTFIFLLAFQIACGQTQDIKDQNTKLDTRIEKAKEQATEMFEDIANKSNYDKVADFAHPKAIEMGGGREKYIESMKQAYQSAFANFESFSWKTEEPQNLIQIDKDLYILIPSTLEAISHKNNKVVQKGHLIGISADNGENWKFVNGNYFYKVFPTLIGKIQIPKDKVFINGIEQ